MAYAYIWALDFEYRALDGNTPEVVCMCAVDALSGREIRLWGEELKLCPFRTDESSLFVAYYASAEISCFLALGWPVPVRILDLFAEFRALTNGRKPPSGNKLLGALAYCGLAHMALGEKKEMIARILAGPPWSRQDREDILAYCMEDVNALLALLPVMERKIAASPVRFGQALLRGRYMAAAARMERVGIPVDTELLTRLHACWDAIKLALIEDVDQAYGVFENGVFKHANFAALVARLQLPWPRTATGRLATDNDTLKDMARLCPELTDLKELMSTLGQTRLFDIPVGTDGRNRCLLSAFQAITGRNQPSSKNFVFGPATWMRSLIKPESVAPIAYIDWSAQEIGIAACLSDDERLIEAALTGDPYLAFAISAGLAPRGATKADDLPIRDTVKSCVLGINYGMGARTLGARIKASTTEARFLLQLHAETYPAFSKWKENHLNRSLLGFAPITIFGWELEPLDTTKPTTLKNFPIQATGAEMLRLACCLATEAGVRVCAPVHDAILVEAAPGQSIKAAVALAKECMAEASKAVLGGIEIPTEEKIVRFPGRYQDKRGKALFSKISRFLKAVEMSHLDMGTSHTYIATNKKKKERKKKEEIYGLL